MIRHVLSLSLCAAGLANIAYAEQIGRYEDEYTATSAAQNLRTMHLEKYSNPNIHLPHDPTRCDLVSQGGYFRVDISDGEDLTNKVYGGGFPSELVDVEIPLRNGFTNHIEIVSTEISESWTAEFKNGKLIIENTTRAQDMKPLRQRFEVETKSNVLNAETMSWKAETDHPKLKPSSFTCKKLNPS